MYDYFTEIVLIYVYCKGEVQHYMHNVITIASVLYKKMWKFDERVTRLTQPKSNSSLEKNQ